MPCVGGWEWDCEWDQFRLCFELQATAATPVFHLTRVSHLPKSYLGSHGTSTGGQGSKRLCDWWHRSIQVLNPWRKPLGGGLLHLLLLLLLLRRRRRRRRRPVEVVSVIVVAIAQR